MTAISRAVPLPGLGWRALLDLRWSCVLRHLAGRRVRTAMVEQLAVCILADQRRHLGEHCTPVAPLAQESPRRAEEPRRAQYLRGLLAVREQVEEPPDVAFRMHVTDHLRQHRRHPPGLAEVTGEPVMLGELAVAPLSPARQTGVLGVAGTVQPLNDRRHERVDLSESIADPAPRRGILKMAGVTDEHPARPARLPEEAGPVQHPEELAHPRSARQRIGHRLAA